jgi:hypothetical protein
MHGLHEQQCTAAAVQCKESAAAYVLTALHQHGKPALGSAYACMNANGMTQ